FQLRHHGHGEPRRGQDRKRRSRMADGANPARVRGDDDLLRVGERAGACLWAVRETWGVLVTDSIQFGITMTGTFAVAYFALAQPEVGGLAGLLAKVPPKSLDLVPDFGDWSIAATVF